MFKNFKMLKWIAIFLMAATLTLTVSAHNTTAMEVNSAESSSTVTYEWVKPECIMDAVNEQLYTTASCLKEAYANISARLQQRQQEIKRSQVDINKDVLFIGNSLTEGMRLTTYSENKFISEVGVSLDGLKLHKLNDIEFKVAIINMGTNELGHYDEQHFKNSYTKLIQAIYDANPEAIIICCSVPPIAENTFYAPVYNNENAKIYSQYIQDICLEQNVEFLDNSEFFGDDLNPDWTSDGLHFAGNIYIQWYNFLLQKI